MAPSLGIILSVGLLIVAVVLLIIGIVYFFIYSSNSPGQSAPQPWWVWLLLVLGVILLIIAIIWLAWATRKAHKRKAMMTTQENVVKGGNMTTKKGVSVAEYSDV